MLNLCKNKLGSISISTKSLENMIKNSFSNCKDSIIIEKAKYINDNVNRHALDVYVNNKSNNFNSQLLEWINSEIKYNVYAKLNINDININIIFNL